MYQSEIDKKLSGEMIRLGLPGNLARKISADLSGRLAGCISTIEKGNDMVSLLGAVTIPEIQARISTNYPKYTKTDYGIFSVTSNVIRNHPDWTADQVYAEVEKTVKPASAGGYLVIPKALQDRRAKGIMLVAGSVVAIFALSFLTRKRQTID